MICLYTAVVVAEAMHGSLSFLSPLTLGVNRGKISLLHRQIILERTYMFHGPTGLGFPCGISSKCDEAIIYTFYATEIAEEY